MSARPVSVGAALAAAAVLAGLLLVLPTARPARGQVPAPRAPGRPAAPRVAARPPDPAVAAHQLSLALLEVNTRHRRADSLALDVAGSLLVVSGGRDVHPLSASLVEVLRNRPLAREARERIAGSVVEVLAGRDLESALREVRAALSEAGLHAPQIVLVENELRRLGRSRR
jgi:hypothetical protein